MAGTQDDAASLRLALAEAERMRDVALARCAVVEGQQQDERRDEQHHLRNMISIIRTIVRRTGEDAKTVEDYSGLLEARLASYLGVQAALPRNRSYGLDLELLIRDELLRFQLDDNDRIGLSGPSVELMGHAAGLIALAVHDLLFGLILGGFEDKDATLAIAWGLKSEGSEQLLHIDWLETGVDDDRPDEPSNWAASLPLAIEYQLSGTMISAVTRGERSVRFRLPADCYTVPNIER